jgi:hypothetical protein
MSRATLGRLRGVQRSRSIAHASLNPTTWAAVVAASRETDSGVATNIAVKLQDAFRQLCDGSTDDDLFDRLASAINIGMIRAEKIDALLEASMVAGRDALIECDGIRGRHGRYGFTGPGLAAMRVALDDYETIVAASTPHLMQAAIDESIRRMYAGEIISH